MMPGMSAVTDTFEFMKNLWGGMGSAGMGLPGMVMPTLSVEEINKQITDLKAVESWLTMNMNMLRGAIHALEVQSATLVALQSMGQTLSASAKSPAATTQAPPAAGASGSAQTDNTGFSAPMPNPAAWWGMLQDQFKQAVATATSSDPAPAVEAKPAAKSTTARKRKSPPGGPASN